MLPGEENTDPENDKELHVSNISITLRLADSSAVACHSLRVLEKQDTIDRS